MGTVVGLKPSGFTANLSTPRSAPRKMLPQKQDTGILKKKEWQPFLRSVHQLVFSQYLQMFLPCFLFHLICC